MFYVATRKAHVPRVGRVLHLLGQCCSEGGTPPATGGRGAPTGLTSSRRPSPPCASRPSHSLQTEGKRLRQPRDDAAADWDTCPASVASNHTAVPPRRARFTLQGRGPPHCEGVALGVCAREAGRKTAEAESSSDPEAAFRVLRARARAPSSGPCGPDLLPSPAGRTGRQTSPDALTLGLCVWFLLLP